jgi:exodeoxyribonuclease-5
MVTLNQDQAQALEEILAAHGGGRCARHLLTGYAGTGKTTLMQAVASKLQALGKSVVLTAPTNKAVKVLAAKVQEAGLKVPCQTIHSLLGLKPVHNDSEETRLKRIGRSTADDYNVIVVDECSMVGAELSNFIAEDLNKQFVLYVGDPAQLSPVTEDDVSSTFRIPSRSHLGTIVRQEADNPILAAATAIRSSDPAAIDWAWARQAEAGPRGVYLAGNDADDWMRDAFTSSEFQTDNDSFRALAYTNERVAAINAKAHNWVYGDSPTPFVPGERAICRSPIEIKGVGPAFSLNDEPVVANCRPGIETFKFRDHAGTKNGAPLPAWSAEVQVWHVTLQHDRLGALTCAMARNERQRRDVDDQLIAEAKQNRGRWFERFQFKEGLATLQHCYAMTTHVSQGSTFGNVFLDILDIRKLEHRRPAEMLRLLYVGATRPTTALILVGA